jgi:hypothetical protein
VNVAAVGLKWLESDNRVGRSFSGDALSSKDVVCSARIMVALLMCD